MKSLALAALAERTASTGRLFATSASGWDGRDVWLTRVRQTHALAARSSMNEPSTPLHQDTTVRA